MITMENWATQAVKKLEAENKSVAGQKEKVMAGAVLAAIKDFCLQNEAFAQKVAQGGSFADCMKKVASGVGNAISDVDAYKKAVQFYFPSAEVKMQLTIELSGKDDGKERPATEPVAEAPKQNVILDLASFF